MLIPPKESNPLPLKFSAIRPPDLVWILLFAVLAVIGPDRSVYVIVLLLALALLQVFERQLPSLIASIGIKLVLCYALIGWTKGIASSYYWVLLLPVISAATNLELAGTLVTTLVASISYLSFLLFLDWNRQFIPQDQVEELAMRVLLLPVVGYLTHQLADANRAEGRRYQAVAEQLTEAEDAVRRSDRLAALGQLSAGLAHELRNPLGTMKNSAEMLLRSVANENEIAREMAGFIASEVDRTNSLISRFLDFARPLALRPEQANLTETLDRAVDELGRHQPAFDVVIYKNYDPDVRPFRFDPELMERVFYNLLLNAAQASPPQGSITVKTRQQQSSVEIAVIDRGSGINAEHRENIFNPFFTTKAAGVGLGLAIVSKIVDEHGGEISIESEPGQGSVFRISLPVSETSA